MTAPTAAPGIDEQIAYAEYLAEGESMSVQRALLDSIKELKRIMEAKVPEPVATVTFSSNLSGVTVRALPVASSALSTGDKLYGPEVLDLLRLETAKNQKLAIELQSLLSQSMEKESEIKRIKELLREPSEGMIHAGLAAEGHIDDEFKAMSAALLAEVEKEKK
jgi:hypothetical protein